MERREIKFRGIPEDKTEDEIEFIYGSLVKLNDDNFCIYEFGKTNLYAPIVMPETIGQFSGFQDLNEVEIFEHDILKGFGQEEKMTVMFENGSFCVYNSFGYWGSLSRLFEIYERYDEEVLVIGNIHNPHKKP